MDDLKFYSIAHKAENNSFSLIEISSTVIDCWDDDGESSVAYRISDSLGNYKGNQPYLYKTIEKVASILSDPCLDLEKSSYHSPCFDEVESFVDSLVAVKIHLSENKLDDSDEVFLYILNENHPKFSPDSNSIIQHNDGLPPSNATYADDPFREHIVSKNVDDFPIVIDYGQNIYYTNKGDFPEDSYDKVKFYMNISECLKN